jgi:transcription termination factor Rho
LQTGDTVSGQIRPPKEGERYFALIKVEAVNFEAPDQARDKLFFENLTPLYPLERIKLETEAENLSARVMDLMTPLGKGQRGLIVAPPRTGKTMLLQAIAQSVAQEPSRDLPDRPADRRASRRSHRHAAIGRRRGDLVHVRRTGAAPRAGRRDGDRKGQAPRRAQEGRADPARLGHASRRAYNTVIPASARCSRAVSTATRLQKPKRFFGAARNIEEGGLAHHRRHSAHRHRLAHGRCDLSRSSRAPATAKSIWTASCPTSARSRRSTSSRAAPARKSC